MVPLVGPDGLRVTGFDPQLSGDYSDDLVDDLEDFLDEGKASDKAVNFDLLDETVGYLAEHYVFPPSQTLAAFEAELARADAAAAPRRPPRPAPRAAPRPRSGSSACAAWARWPATTPPTISLLKPPPPSWPPIATRAMPKWPTTCCGTCASIPPKRSSAGARCRILPTTWSCWAMKSCAPTARWAS
ncbi:MAG: hypothetical protein WKG07_45500 [Hymenobacter sp.]